MAGAQVRTLAADLAAVTCLAGMKALIPQLAAAGSPEELAAAAGAAAAHIPGAVAVVLKVDPATGQVGPLTAADGDEGPAQRAASTLAGWVARVGEPIFSWRLVDKPDPPLARLLFPRRESAACLPVSVAGQPWGVLAVYHPEAGALRDHVACLELLAGTLGLAAAKLEAEGRAYRQGAHLYALREINRLAATAPVPLGVLSLVADVLTMLLALDVCCVLVPGPGGALRVEAARGREDVGVPALSNAPPAPDLFRGSGIERVEVLPLPGRAGPAGYLVAGRRTGSLDAAEQPLLATWAAVAGLAVELGRLAAERGDMPAGSLESLVTTLEEYLQGRSGHARAVAAVAAALAARLNLGETERQDLQVAALLHDVGLFLPGAPGAAAGPPAASSGRHHAAAGGEFLAATACPRFQRAAPAVRHHHEHWDGSGQPDGLRGEAIPLLARILAVAEAYVSGLEGRQGRPARNPVAAWLAVKAGAGRRYDPQVVQALEGMAWSDLPLGAGLPTPPHRVDGPEAAPARPEPRLPLALGDLTEREREILDLVAQGLTNREIAARLHLSAATVKTHVSRILHKLDLPDRTKAAVYRLKARVYN